MLYPAFNIRKHKPYMEDPSRCARKGNLHIKAVGIIVSKMPDRLTHTAHMIIYVF